MNSNKHIWKINDGVDEARRSGLWGGLRPTKKVGHHLLASEWDL